MDPYGGGPLVYKTIDDDFLLYSFGINLKDDGGEPGRDSKGQVKKWSDNGDTVIWPLPEMQSD